MGTPINPNDDSQNIVKIVGNPSIEHPQYSRAKKNWGKVRDCVEGEETVKGKAETYLPRPAGMSGEYAEAYKDYIERAHFPHICGYALQGALGVINTKLPDFNVPAGLEYIKTKATKDGLSLNQLFLDILIEILKTGRCPLVVDVMANTNTFAFIRYNAEDLINWKLDNTSESRKLTLAVLREKEYTNTDKFSHDTEDVYRVLEKNAAGDYTVALWEENVEESVKRVELMGKSINDIPLFVAGSINNDYNVQPVPLLSVANCSIQIYRKEADLANSEFLSCNPTLVFTGVSNDNDTPNVVGSSVLITLPDPQARAFYTTTDTAALNHVKEHIADLYDEGIRHGIAILDTRKGVESAEALRIRQATQSATIYSMYLSAINVIINGLKLMCRWSGLRETAVSYDAPASLTFDITDSKLMSLMMDGYEKNLIPLTVLHRYLVGGGYIDANISYKEYFEILKKQKEERKEIEVESIADTAIKHKMELDEKASNQPDPVVQPIPAGKKKKNK